MNAIKHLAIYSSLATLVGTSVYVLEPKASSENVPTMKGALSTHQETTSTANRIAQTELELSKLQSQHQELVLQVRYISAQLEKLSSNTPLSSQSQAESRAIEPQRSPETQQLNSEELNRKSQQHADQRVLKLEEAFALDANDESRSSLAESKLREVTKSTAFAGSHLTSVSCKATICRLEVDHDSKNALDEFVGNFTLALGWASSMEGRIYDANARGEIKMTIFISRDGHNLPSGA